VTSTRSRGSVGAYVVAFALMLASATCLVVATVGGQLESLRLLRVASGLGAAAIVAAVAAVAWPRRSA
jgi:hypothetical protein